MCPGMDVDATHTTVLLALEHQPSADLLGDRLRRAGLEVPRVEDGEAAHERIQETDIDVVVAQVRLPGRTGLELLRSLPPMCPPVVLLGRRGNDDEIVRAFEMGAAEFITRPFAPRVAVARIQRCLQFRAAARPSSVPEALSTE